MSRIVAGSAGGTPLASVPGDGTRPTTDRVKEALFSRLESMDMLADVRVLDLYAGSGSLGVESASRGARSVELVEFNDKAAGVCQRNAELVNKVRGSKVVSVQRSRVEPFLARVAEAGVDQWDLVFLDPPYPLAEAELSLVLELLGPGSAPMPSWWWNAPPARPNRPGRRRCSCWPRKSTAKRGSGSPSPRGSERARGPGSR